MFAKVNLAVKKFVSLDANIFVLCIFLANMSKWQKNAFKVWKKDFLQVCLIVTKGILAKLNDLESESDIFL